MKILELLSEKKLKEPTAGQCASKNLSNVRRSQCVARGLKAHQTDHTDGTGTQGVKGSGRRLKGKKARSEKFGGVVKDYS